MMEKTALYSQQVWKIPIGSDTDHSRFTEIREIEMGCLDLRYTHTRVKRPESISSLADSIRRSGQVVRVVTVKESDFCFVIIDGYLRVAALKRCGQDMVMAEIWPLKEAEALVRALMSSQERKLETIEQALVIRELKVRHGLSQGEIARLMGRNQSWTSRRLALLDALPEEILELVQKGGLSTWSATRVLVPMARAIPGHAKKLTETLLKEPLSTRTLSEFFRHYKRANRSQREKMGAEPLLFLKALHYKEEESKASLLKEGPGGRWIKELKVLAYILRRLIKDLPTVIYRGQNSEDRCRLLATFHEVKGLFLALDQRLRRQNNDDIT